MVTLCLTLWQTAKLFSKVAAQFDISTTSVWELQFLQIFATFLIVFLIIAILAEVVSDYLVSDYLDEVVVWFWFDSQITNDFEQLFSLLDILISSLKKRIFKSLPIFSFFVVKCSTPLLYLQVFGLF